MRGGRAAVSALFRVGCGGATARESHTDGRTPVIIGRGQTAAGKPFIAMAGVDRIPARYRRSKFVAELEPQGGCSLPVFVREDRSRWSYEVCYSRSEISQEVGIQCEDGQLVIHFAAPATTRMVRLRLSDGQEVVSGVMFLPRRLGGPLALYYQSLSSLALAPVAATELAGDGRVLARIPAYTVHECTKTLMRRLPGGSVIVKANAPNRETFTVTTERTRMLGRTYVGLRLAFSSGVVTESAALRVAPSLRWNVGRVCGSRPYSVVYGILDEPHNETLVRVGGRLERLHVAPVMSGTPSRDVVVYKILTRSPERLVVRAPSGRVRPAEDE